MKYYFLTLCLLIAFNIEAASLRNTLNNHASPYLAMHGSDPVVWQEWNKETVARAKKEGKLLFVSSGYFSCHWCHVMQRESYKNSKVANILNNHFIPVKVDREINSALDSHLIDFVERTQGHAGWPLNVFITPDGYPLVGTTYVPTENFIAILNNLKKKWFEERETLEKIAINATKELSEVTDSIDDKLKSQLLRKYSQLFLTQAKIMMDDFSGGFGQQNKFPSYPQLSALLKMYKKNKDKELKEFLLLTLNKMASQGLNDQLSGGFFRYAVDPNWQIPHFEKMLYDNALLANLYIEAAQIFNNKYFEKVAKNTLNFMLQVFRSPQGAYIASLSAVDNNNVEGGYYLWHDDELKKALTESEIKIINLMWQLDGPPDLEGGHHLVEVMPLSEVAKTLKVSTAYAEKIFSSAKKKMLKIRSKRIIPRDDKLLAAWNGLALSAYAKAAKQFNSETYATAAKEIKSYIYKFLWKNKSLSRAVKKGEVLGVGALEDYAYVAQGVSDWLKYKENNKDRVWLAELLKQGWLRFHTKSGWRLSENALLKYGQDEVVLSDGVLPAASAVLIRVSLNQPKLTPDLRKKALKAASVSSTAVFEQPFWYASHIINSLKY